MNHVTTLFGASHDKWVNSLRDAVAKRETRLRVVRAIHSVSRLIRSDAGNDRRRTLLKRLRRSLRARATALGDGGLDPKLAKHILSTTEKS